eukprot:3481200-Pyramimonas_sp.AAC.1
MESEQRHIEVECPSGRRRGGSGQPDLRGGQQLCGCTGDSGSRVVLGKGMSTAAAHGRVGCDLRPCPTPSTTSAGRLSGRRSSARRKSTAKLQGKIEKAKIMAEKSKHHMVKLKKTWCCTACRQHVTADALQQFVDTPCETTFATADEIVDVKDGSVMGKAGYIRHT